MSLLRTEGVLPGEEVEEEENIHHNFALVERWREVSKVIIIISGKTPRQMISKLQRGMVIENTYMKHLTHSCLV